MEADSQREACRVPTTESSGNARDMEEVRIAKLVERERGMASGKDRVKEIGHENVIEKNQEIEIEADRDLMIVVNPLITSTGTGKEIREVGGIGRGRKGALENVGADKTTMLNNFCNCRKIEYVVSPGPQNCTRSTCLPSLPTCATIGLVLSRGTNCIS